MKSIATFFLCLVLTGSLYAYPPRERVLAFLEQFDAIMMDSIQRVSVIPAAAVGNYQVLGMTPLEPLNYHELDGSEWLLSLLSNEIWIDHLGWLPIRYIGTFLTTDGADGLFIHTRTSELFVLFGDKDLRYDFCNLFLLKLYYWDNYSALLSRIPLESDRNLSPSNPRYPTKDWLFETEVTFISDHDDGRLTVDKDRSLFVDTDDYYLLSQDNQADRKITYDLVQQWSPRRTLKICYSTETGAVLLDPATNAYIRIIGGLEKHPLDLLLAQKIEADGSTMGMVVAADKVTEIWLKEIEASYSKLKTTHPEKQDLIEQAQSAWENYYKQQTGLLSLMIDQAGTLSSVNQAMSRLGLVKNHALRMAM